MLMPPEDGSVTKPQLLEQDIDYLIPEFYRRVRADNILGPIFEGAISDWAEHLEKLQAFWSSVMLTSGRYKGQPMAAHLRHIVHMTPENFGRWLSIWRSTTAELLNAENACAMQAKADRIAESLQLGAQFHLERSEKS